MNTGCKLVDDTIAWYVWKNDWRAWQTALKPVHVQLIETTTSQFFQQCLQSTGWRLFEIANLLNFHFPLDAEKPAPTI